MNMSKRERTKRKIATSAIDLFSSEGYDNVTVAQIVKVVGVSHMTFFRNFPTRSHVVTNFIDFSELTKLISQAPATYSPMEAVCWTLLRFMDQVNHRADPPPHRHLLLIADSPTLNNEILGPHSIMDDRVSTALQQRGIDSWLASTTTGAVLGAMGGALSRWKDSDENLCLQALSLEVVKALLDDAKRFESVVNDAHLTTI